MDLGGLKDVGYRLLSYRWFDPERLEQDPLNDLDQSFET